MAENIEFRWTGKGFLPVSIRGVKVRALQSVPQDELKDFAESAEMVNRYIATPWNKGDAGTSGKIPGKDEFRDFWNKRTRYEKLFAEALKELGEPDTDLLVQWFNAETGEEWTWKEFNGIKSGWSRAADKYGYERLFSTKRLDDGTIVHNTNEKFRKLLDDITEDEGEDEDPE